MPLKYQLNSITKEELHALSNDDLCDRMEKTLINILHESYSDIRAIENFPRHSIKDFYETKTITRLEPEHQRKVLRKCILSESPGKCLPLSPD
ncbi:hypothetical protein TUM19329_12540 [Legionella antarctica]|uniref:Uncharacterized protein n=1 Tax=Legionella antarctica TaxID=2708020 RepID=A0A6F8T3W1_9GAMM|nr:hypothetical protein TUM19329_12540 [Legionella antarctica]